MRYAGSERSDIPILLLAAGASRRMAPRDKLLLPIAGKALLRKQAETALAVSRDLRIALPPAPHPRYDVLADLPAKRIQVPGARKGMAESLRALMSSVQGQSCAMILLADLPKLTASDLQKILTAQQQAPDYLIWRGMGANGQPGHPILVSAQLFDAFKTLHGDRGGAQIIKRHQAQTFPVPLPSDHAWYDLDTPEQWEAFRVSGQVC